MDKCRLFKQLNSIFMKNIFSLVLTFLLSVLIISSCYYDKEQLLYGGGTCTDTTGTVSYSQNIVPLLQQYCYSCHSGNFPSGNITMGTHTTDKTTGLNGSLYGSINHSAGYSPMPQGTAKMGSCEIAKIKKWIDTGMLNN
jgi:hypothetical protein